MIALYGRYDCPSGQVRVKAREYRQTKRWRFAKSRADTGAKVTHYKLVNTCGDTLEVIR